MNKNAEENIKKFRANISKEEGVSIEKAGEIINELNGIILKLSDNIEVIVLSMLTNLIGNKKINDEEKLKYIDSMYSLIASISISKIENKQFKKLTIKSFNEVFLKNESDRRGEI